MITSPQMGLIIWNDSSDAYNSEEQAENWAKVDQHDHTSGKGALITTGAIADAAVTADKLDSSAFTSAVADGSITAPKLASDSVLTAKINDGAVTGPKLTDEIVSGSKLTDDVVGVYQNIFITASALASQPVAGTYILSPHTQNVSSGSEIDPTTFPVTKPLIRLAVADYTMAGRTPKLRLRGGVAANATAPGTITATFGLYPVTIAGSANRLAYSIGTVVAGSTTAIVNPSASTLTPAVGSDFDIPANGYYTIGVVTSAQVAANSLLGLHGQLQLHYV